MSGTNKSILLVEDEVILAMTEKMQLAKYGYSVQHVTTGEKAVHAILENVFPIDLILMDMDLGSGIDGTQAAEQILKHKEIPIVFLSSHTETEVVDKTEKITSYGYVVKSSSIVVLDASIKMALKLFYANRKVENELAERKQAENKIQVMDVQREKLFTNVPELIYQFTRRPDGSYCVPIASAGIKNIFGCSPEDVRDDFEPISRVIYPEDAARVIEDIEYSAKHLTYFTCEFRVHIPGKDIQWILSRSTPEKLPDGSITWYGFNADITARKQAELSIGEQRDFSESLIETAQAIILVLDTQGCIVRFNPYMEKLSGYALDEVKGKDWFETFIQPQNGHTVKSVFHQAVTGTHTSGNINPIIAKDGRAIIVEWYDNTLKDKDGRTKGILAIGYDITERKKTQEALFDTTEQLEHICKMARIGGWELDLATMQVEYSKETAHIHEVNFPYVPPKLSQCSEYYPPEVWPDVQAAVLAAIEHGTAYDREWPFITAKGNHLWVRVQGFCIKEKGKPIKLHGTFQDITERKRLEQELIQQKNFLEKILQTTSDGFWVVTPDKKIADANPAYCQMSGYTIEELTRMEINDLDGVENPQETAARIKRIIKNGSEIFETKHRQKDGSLLNVEISASLLDRSDGMFLICFCRDITERKQAEEIIQKQLTEKEILLQEVHHRIKNNMNSMKGILLLQAGRMNDKTAITAFEDASNRMESMAILYDQLYQSSGFTELSIKTYVSHLADAIISNIPGGSSVKIEKQIDDIILDAKRLQPIGIIINELLTNIMKYAFIDKCKGIITISAILEKGHIIIVVQDNGIGIPSSINLENSTGFGLILVHALAGQIDANILIERKGGTRFVLDILL